MSDPLNPRDLVSNPNPFTFDFHPLHKTMNKIFQDEMKVCRRCVDKFMDEKYKRGWVDCEDTVNVDNFKCENCGRSLPKGSVYTIWEYPTNDEDDYNSCIQSSITKKKVGVTD